MDPDHTIKQTLHKWSLTFNISRALVGNKIVDHSDVVEALLVDAAPTAALFST